jgi:hypothetical protein
MISSEPFFKEKLFNLKFIKLISHLCIQKQFGAENFCYWKADLNVNSQIREQGFEEKEVRFIIHQRQRRTGRVNPSKFCHPNSERKCLLFKREFRGSV